MGPALSLHAGLHLPAIWGYLNGNVGADVPPLPFLDRQS